MDSLYCNFKLDKIIFIISTQVIVPGLTWNKYDLSKEKMESK